jgi:glycosyl transferase, family 25
MMKIFVINLESAGDRKESMFRQLDSLGLSAEFFKAVDGRTENHQLFTFYNPGMRWKKRGKTLSKGQLGCFASHYLLWEHCVRLAMPIIILEDDALLHRKQFLNFCNAASHLDRKYESIRLFENHSKHHRSIIVENINGFHIAKFTKGHMRATGYYLTPSGAKKFMKHANPLFLPVDIYMDRFWANGVECYGVIPACLRNDPRFPSTIGYAPKDEKPLSIKLRREIFALGEQIRKRVHNMKFRINNKKILARTNSNKHSSIY